MSKIDVIAAAKEEADKCRRCRIFQKINATFLVRDENPVQKRGFKNGLLFIKSEGTIPAWIGR